MKDLKGKVKTLTINDFDAIDKSDTVTPNSMIKQVLHHYDKNMNKKAITIILNFEPKFYSKYVHKFDIKGNEIECIRYDSDDKIIYRTTYKYDTKGNKIEEYFQDVETNVKYINIYKYDNENILIELIENCYNSKHIKTIFKYTYEFSETGKTMIEKIYDNDKLDQISYVKYNENGNIVESKTHNSKLKSIRAKYKYDDNGNLIELRKYNSTRLSSKLLYKYEDNKIITDHVYYDDDIEEYVKKEVEDKDGNVIEWTTCDKNNNISTEKISYRIDNYDKKGNWLRKLMMSNDKFKFLTLREIEYF